MSGRSIILSERAQSSFDNNLDGFYHLDEVYRMLEWVLVREPTAGLELGMALEDGRPLWIIKSDEDSTRVAVTLIYSFDDQFIYIDSFRAELT